MEHLLFYHESRKAKMTAARQAGQNAWRNSGHVLRYRSPWPVNRHHAALTNFGASAHLGPSQTFGRRSPTDRSWPGADGRMLICGAALQKQKTCGSPRSPTAWGTGTSCAATTRRRAGGSSDRSSLAVAPRSDSSRRRWSSAGFVDRARNSVTSLGPMVQDFRHEAHGPPGVCDRNRRHVDDATGASHRQFAGGRQSRAKSPPSTETSINGVPNWGLT